MAESNTSKGRKGAARPEHWFTTNKRMCRCQEFNLENIPQLLRLLPENYDYKLCDYSAYDGEDKFNITLRISLSTIEEVMLWKQLYEEKSLTSHVVEQTFPKPSAARVFKRYYRCKFGSVRKKQLAQGGSLGCPAMMSIIIRGWGWSKACKVADPHLETHPTQVRIRFAHNHPLDTPEMLSKRELCPEIRKRFEEMFQQGIKPKDALEKHKWDLHKQLGPEKYLAVAIDGFYMPKQGRLKKMYQTISGEKSVKSSSKRVSKHNPDADRLAFEQCASKFAESQRDELRSAKGQGDPDATDSSRRSGECSRLETAFDNTSMKNHTEASDNESLEKSSSLSCAHLESYLQPLGSLEKSALSVQPSCQGQSNVLFPGPSAPVLTLQNMESLSFDSSSSCKLSHVTVSSSVQPELCAPAFQEVGGTTLDVGPHSEVASSSLSDHNITQHRSSAPAMTDSSAGALQPHSTATPAPQATTSHSFPSLHHHHHHRHHVLNSSGGSSSNSSLAHHTHSSLAHPHNLSSNFSSSGFRGYHHSHPNPTVSHCFYSQNVIGQNSSPQNVLSHFNPCSFGQGHPTDAHTFHPYSIQNKRFPPYPPFSGSHLSLHPQLHNSQCQSKPSQAANSSSQASDSGRGRPMKRKGANVSLNASAPKKFVPKRNPINLYNAKRFRASLLKKKSPMVNTDTHQLVSEALQNILLADKAKRVKERLSEFCIRMEQKLTADGRTYVPVVTKLLDTWDRLLCETDLTRAMKEFGKAPQTVIKEYELRRRDSLRDKRVQTQQSSPAEELAPMTACSSKKGQTIASTNQCAISPPDSAPHLQTPGGLGKMKRRVFNSTNRAKQLRLKPLTPTHNAERANCTSSSAAQVQHNSLDATASDYAVARKFRQKSGRGCHSLEKTSSIYNHVSSPVLLQVQNSVKNKTAQEGQDVQSRKKHSCLREKDASISMSSGGFPQSQNTMSRKSNQDCEDDTTADIDRLFPSASQRLDTHVVVAVNEGSNQSGCHNDFLSPAQVPSNGSAPISSPPLTPTDPSASASFSRPAVNTSGVSHSQDTSDMHGEVTVPLGALSSGKHSSECPVPGSAAIHQANCGTADSPSTAESRSFQGDVDKQTSAGYSFADNCLSVLMPKEEPSSPSETAKSHIGATAMMDVQQPQGSCNVHLRQSPQPSASFEGDTESGRAAGNSVERDKRLVVKLTRISLTEM